MFFFNRKALALLVAAAFTCTVLHGGNRPAAVCWKLKEPVKFNIDAMAKAMKNTSEMTGFSIIGKGKPKPAPNQSFVKSAWDSKYLYFLFRCEFPEGAKLSPAGKGNDAAIFNRDSIELYLYPGNKKIFYQIGYDVSGKGRFDKKGWNDKSWQADWNVICRTDTMTWESLIRIPFASFGPPPKNGDYWPINLARNDMLKRKYTSWSHTTRFYGDRNFTGYLFFCDRTANAKISATASKLPLSAAQLAAFRDGYFKLSSVIALHQQVTVFLRGEGKLLSAQKLQTLATQNQLLRELMEKFKTNDFAGMDEFIIAARKLQNLVGQLNSQMTKSRLDALFARNRKH